MMKAKLYVVILIGCCLIVAGCKSTSVISSNHPSNPYLDSIKKIMKTEWPKNRTINLVFHGHSVPSGYFKTPDVKTFDAYPLLTLKKVKDLYPYAVVNAITTSIGGDNSVAGAKRFEQDVLVHKPDVLFIDYAINDAGLELDVSKKAWEEMIEKALAKNIKVILLTPSPNLKVDINDSNDALYKHSEQIIMLAKKYNIGLADSYGAFRNVKNKTGSLGKYMAQFNHPNKKGHELIVNEIIKWFY